jgi:hypothetical protein
MIAPLREPEPEDDSAACQLQLHFARQIVAATLLQPAVDASDPPRVSAWQAWLLAAWMALITAAYGWFMSGIASG